MTYFAWRWAIGRPQGPRKTTRIVTIDADCNGSEKNAGVSEIAAYFCSGPMLFPNGAHSFPEMMFFGTINRQLNRGWRVGKAVAGVVEEVVVL